MKQTKKFGAQENRESRRLNWYKQVHESKTENHSMDQWDKWLLQTRRYLLSSKLKIHELQKWLLSILYISAFATLNSCWLKLIVEGNHYIHFVGNNSLCFKRDNLSYSNNLWPFVQLTEHQCSWTSSRKYTKPKALKLGNSSISQTTIIETILQSHKLLTSKEHTIWRVSLKPHILRTHCKTRS